MAFQTGIITAVTAYAATVKAAVANQAALRCGTGIAIRTMLIVGCGTVNAHLAVVTPIIRAAGVADVITGRTLFGFGIT